MLTPISHGNSALRTFQLNKELVYVDDNVILTVKKVLDMYKNGDGEEKLKSILSKIKCSR